jgi:amino acid permease
MQEHRKRLHVAALTACCLLSLCLLRLLVSELRNQALLQALDALIFAELFLVQPLLLGRQQALDCTRLRPSGG